MRWLKSRAPSLTARRKPTFASQHNHKVLSEYQRRQNFDIMVHGPLHSEVTRYVAALPELVEMFLKRYPDWNRLEFVINSGDHQLFADDGHTLGLYARNDIVVVWRDTRLVFRSIPGQVLDQVILRRTPEKLLIRALSQIETDLTQDDDAASR